MRVLCEINLWCYDPQVWLNATFVLVGLEADVSRFACNPGAVIFSSFYDYYSTFLSNDHEKVGRLKNSTKLCCFLPFVASSNFAIFVNRKPYHPIRNGLQSSVFE